MRIIVCIKEVGHIYYPIAIDASTQHIDKEKMVWMLNPYDEIAVEEAVRIKENLNNCEIIIITVGPPRVEKALRYSFAFGADKMLRINYKSSDPWSTALVLAKVIEPLKYDLLLCGKKAIDNNGRQVGSFIADLLNIPQVSGIVKLELVSGTSKRAIAERYLGKGDRQVVECSLPAMFTVEIGLNDPRYPSLRNRLIAEKEEIQVIDISSLELQFDRVADLTTHMNFSPRRPKPKKVFTPDSNLSADERMKLIMSGGNVDKKSDLLENGPEDLAKELSKFLVQHKIV